MSSTLGDRVRISIFGQSHGEMIGAVIDGLPAGERIDPDALKALMARRAPGQALTTPRSEKDAVRIVSGLVGDVTCGAPLCLLIENTDVRSADYERLRRLPRPGHADLPAHIKWNGFNDVRGGGHFSARLTAPLCAAGGILMQLYARRGIRIGAHLYEAAGIRDTPMDPMRVSEKDLDALLKAPLPVFDREAGEKMLSAVAEARREGDSRGGIVECAVLGLKPGLGEPMFGGLENLISRAVFAVPAVKGIEFGEGFGAARLRGSENNDPYRMGKDAPASVSNHAGGILGGLATGAPLVFRAAFKPTPSIALKQDTVDLAEMRDASLEITGRHDPCVALRAVPCVEAAAAAALADLIL
ncbi:MAG: chorismate synthase [Clostridia bacterium]|nr:chorismate synthase [Clostridia bacterium]